MPNNYRQAQDLINKRREDAEAEAERRRMELETVSPELKKLNADIASAGLRAVQAIGLGKDAAAEIRSLANENRKNQARQKVLLRELGVPEDYLDVRYTCEKCHDTGVFEGHYCDCFKALVRQLKAESLNSAAPADRMRFDTFDLSYYKGVTDPETGRSAYETMEQICAYCKAYADDFSKDSPNLLLVGRTGLGKTHLSLAIANVVLGKGYQVIYGSAYNLLRRLNDEQFGRAPEGESPEEELLSCDLLILDDLGAEFQTSFTRSAIYNLLNTRLLMGRPTIINTNLGIDELAGQYTERVASRIIGNYVPLEVLGKDVRQLKSNV